jgi:hypothetical protein
MKLKRKLCGEAGIGCGGKLCLLWFYPKSFCQGPGQDLGVVL